jgi:hypothetical protein
MTTLPHCDEHLGTGMRLESGATSPIQCSAVWAIGLECRYINTKVFENHASHG